MKISKSKQELARIIMENGGWRDGAEFSVQNGEHGRISFSTSKPVRHDQKSWMAKGGFQFKIEVCKPLPNWHQTILSREEYFHLYPAPDAEGWIEWNGGECPVERCTLVDVKYADGITNIGVSALTYKTHADHTFGTAGSLLATNWSSGLPVSSIIAYRLHKPESENPESCEPVMSALIGVDMASGSDSTALFTINAKPTVEQMAADYRSAKGYADRKQQEADDAKADADARLKTLELAGEDIGLLLSPITAKQEPELVVTDWRDLQVGDVVWCGGDDRLSPGEYRVMEIEVPDYEGYRAVLVNDGDGGHWIDTSEEWRLIRRP